MKIVYIVTHPMTARFLLRGQMAFMRSRGYDVSLICSPGEGLKLVEEGEGIPVIPVMMEREIRPFRDMVSLFRIYRMLRRMRPDLINASTPKAGLLGVVAAWLCGVPARIYLVRGLRLEGKSGMVRIVLGITERITSSLATSVLCVSQSLAETYTKMIRSAQGKVKVLAAGSSNGVDAGRFANMSREGYGSNMLRQELDLPVDAPVLGFVGRLVRDKGIVELLQAFDRIRRQVPSVRLLLVGDTEEGDPVPDSDMDKIRDDPAITLTGFVPDTAPYYAMMDVLLFPSHREGFPNVPLEAAAAGVPAVGYRTTGTVDAISSGETGWLVDLQDVEAFASAVCMYLQDETLRQSHGRAAQKRAESDFRQEVIWDALAGHYEQEIFRTGSKKSVNSVKRVIDITGSLAGLLLCSPVFLLIAVVLRIKVGSPVFFRQERPGLQGKPFVLYKFRTMLDLRNEAGLLLPDEQRMFPFGSFLRRSSLDELPELLNVLRGEMSLVGPRPLLMQYLDRYSSEQARRHEVKPGLTGWAQINGRNVLTWEEKFRLDVWYVDHRSLRMDLKILLMTLMRVLQREGISAEGHATMPEFLGGTEAKTAGMQDGEEARRRDDSSLRVADSKQEPEAR